MRNADGNALTIMKQLLIFIVFASLISCNQTKNKSNKNENTLTNEFTVFDKSNHLQPDFEKSKFDTLHGWDLGWALLEPINIAKTQNDDKELSKRFSPGQKALYFIWYLDAEVTNGGFIQFYWNGYRKYLPAINDGLKLIGDNSMVSLINKADKEYLANKDKFAMQRQKDDWAPLYENLTSFDKFDSLYYATHDEMMNLLEKYARQNPQEFIKLK